MLTDKTILLKSDLGRDALSQRLPVLPIKLRPALILVDGKRTVAELAGMVAAMGGKAALEELASLGLVTVVAETTAAEPSAATPPAEQQAPTLAFADYVITLKDFFGRELGPNGQILILQMAAAPDMKALRPLVARGLDNLKYFKGPAAVDNFKATLGKLAPPA